MKPTPEQELWLVEQKKSPFVNPCVRLFGIGPAGVTCQGCKFLFANVKSRRYYKCEFRDFSNGPKTDHHVNWPACGKFEGRK